MSLEEEVLKEVKPTAAESRLVLKTASELMNKIREVADGKGIPGEPLLVGSVAKDTFLKNPEIDIFVAFPKGTSREDLERWGLQLGEVLEETKRRYAEHPYTHGHFKGYEADVVPCYKLDRPTARMTAVDRTPFHLQYVKEKLKEEQKDEVRLLKQFMKGIDTYGAEARVQGFSGYLCELLLLRFGDFRSVLKAARSWKPPVHLQLDKEGERDFDEPLVFVDPVDGDRNAASAVSTDSLATFIHAAREYLRRPQRNFFFPVKPRPLTRAELIDHMRRRGTTLISISSSAPDLSEDILFPQLRKAEHAILAFLKAQEFRVLRSQPFLSEGEWCLLLEMEVSRLPPVKRHLGPPPWLSNAYSFTKKWEASSDLVAGPYVEGGRLVVEIRRHYVDAAQTLQEALPSLSLGKHLDEAVRSGYNIREGDLILEAEYEDVLTQFLTRRLPWRLKRS